MDSVWVVVITWLVLALAVSLLVARAIRRGEESGPMLRRKARPVPRPANRRTAPIGTARPAPAADRRRQRTGGRSRHP